MVGNSSRIPSTLYCDLFYGNPGADEFRRDHVRVWIMARLREGAIRNDDQLLHGLREDYPGLVISHTELAGVLSEMSERGELRTSAEGYALTQAASTEVDGARDRFDASRRSFLAAVADGVDSRVEEPLTPSERIAVQHCADDLVRRAMLAERQALEVLYENRGDFSHVKSEAQRRSSELAACLEEKIGDALGTRRRELRGVTLSAIAYATDIGKSYLLSLNRSVVCSFFLIRDPHHVENIRTQAKGRTYFLDTNVYLAGLYASQPSHEIVATLLAALAGHGAQLRILPQTLEEINRIEAEVRRVTPRAMGDATFASFLVGSRKAIFTDFWWARQRDKLLDFGTWSELYTNPEKQLPRLEVEVEAVEFDEGEDFPDQIPTFRNAIRGVKGDRRRVVSDAALDHDAEVLVRIAKLQLRGDTDEWGSTVQFLSLDSALGPAVDEARNVLGKRFHKPTHPFGLARLFVPVAGDDLDATHYENFVAAALKDSLGLLDEVSGYSSVTLIEKLDRAGIPVKTLLAAPRELLESALAQLQERKNLNRRLDQALAAGVEERASFVTDIQRDLEDAISVGSELLRDVEGRAAQEAIAKDELENRLSRLDRQLQKMQLALDEQSRVLGRERRMSESLRKRLRTWAIVSIALMAILIVVAVWLFV